MKKRHQNLNRHIVYAARIKKPGNLKTLEEVRAGCIGAAVRLMGKSEEEAKSMADDMLPKLPRWKKVN